MTRRHVSFESGGCQLVATLDEAAGSTGLLWVSGGNEIRCGAFSGQAQLAARIAAAGYPVFRFDRSGVGDSEGINLGFRDSGADIAAALAHFRTTKPELRRVIAFGNCDASSALMLGAGCGCDALVLANPWTFEATAPDLVPQAVRARYRSKLKDPREWLRLARGKVSLAKLVKGLSRAASRRAPATSLSEAMADGLGRFGGRTSIVLAGRDRTGQAFLTHWPSDDPRIRLYPDASHAFAEHDAREWLLAQLLTALADEQARQLDVG